MITFYDYELILVTVKDAFQITGGVNYIQVERMIIIYGPLRSERYIVREKYSAH